MFLWLQKIFPTSRIGSCYFALKTNLVFVKMLEFSIGYENLKGFGLKSPLCNQSQEILLCNYDEILISYSI